MQRKKIEKDQPDQSSIYRSFLSQEEDGKLSELFFFARPASMSVVCDDSLKEFSDAIQIPKNDPGDSSVEDKFIFNEHAIEDEVDVVRSYVANR